MSNVFRPAVVGIALLFLFAGFLIVFRSGILETSDKEKSSTESATQEVSSDSAFGKTARELEVLRQRLPTRLEKAIEPRFSQQYGRVGTAEDDLRLVQDLLLNFRLLFKNHASIPFGGNSDFVRVLAGANVQGLALVDFDHSFISAEGELLDRWGQVLFFHQESSNMTALRSAGPDKTMWTSDDVISDQIGD
ncbi:hypothetical protein OAL62_00940 [bacterium]|nr:hypothetical protein [bacterium]